jgi:hypothetical protein
LLRHEFLRRPIIANVIVPKVYAVLKSWSYSVYTQYCKCPLSVRFDKVDRIRIVEPPNPHFIKGDLVHKAAENYIKTLGKKEPKVIKELTGVAGLLVKFRALKAQVERDWAFTKAYEPTSWYADNAWLRIKTDVNAVQPGEPPLVQIVDWKTGRIYDEHKQQRSLYALGGLQLISLDQIPGAEKGSPLEAQHVYTDTGFEATEMFGPKDLKRLKREWATRIRTMMSDTRYQAHPGFACRYCKFKKSAGGPCPENM